MTTHVVKAQLGVVVVLVGVYFLQLATPLRLHPDTVALLSVAETAAHGGRYLLHGHPTVFPPGYPALLAFLIKLNLAHVWVIIGINVVFLVVGLSAVYHILRSEGFSEFSALGVCLLSLLSFVFAKYSAIPLTDPLFFGVSMCCLALLKKAAAQFDWRTLLGAVALVIASNFIRRIGIALVPALLYTLILQPGVHRYLTRLSVRTKLTIALIIASLGAAIVWALSVTSTISAFSGVLQGHTLMESVRGILEFRLKELGEIAVNLPASALSLKVQAILPVVGCAVFLLMVAGAVWRKFGVVEMYFAGYLAVLLVWPFYDPRFWLPVIPLVIAYCGLALTRLAQGKITTRMVECYVMMFALMGILTLFSSTRLSYSGTEFADLYREGRYHSTYCAVWHCSDSDSAVVDPDGLHLLRYYEKN